MVTDPDNSMLPMSKHATDTILSYSHQCPILTTVIHFNIIPSPSWSYTPKFSKLSSHQGYVCLPLTPYFRHMLMYSSNPRFRCATTI
jgi:hypothetical protein